MASDNRQTIFEIYLFVRVIFALLVIGSIALTQIIAETILNINPLNLALIFLLLVSLLSALFYRGIGFYLWLFHIQFFFDLIAITFLVYITGSYSSPLIILYILFIAVCALILPRNALFRLSGTAVVLYGLLVLSVVSGWVPPYPSEWFPVTPGAYRPAFYNTIIHSFAFILTTILASIPAEAVRTSRAQIERERMKSERLRNLLYFIVIHLPHALLITDDHGNILFANSLAQSIFLGEASLRSIFDLFTLPVDKKSFRLRKMWQFQITFKNRIYSVRTHQITFERSERRWLWFFEDVTEDLKRIERDKIKEKMAAIGQMAAGLAHEVKNPLAALHGAVQLLRKGEVEESDELLRIIESETRRLKNVVENFLNLAKPREIACTKIRVKDLFAEIIHLIQMSPEYHHNIKISYQVFPPDLMMYSDQDKIKQILWNIILNSVKVLNGKGQINLEALQESEWIRFSISDNGPGIPEEKLKNLFQPFQESTTGGLGLGLAIVYNIVEHLGGYINVESSQQQGTVFDIWLPRKSP